MKCTVKKAELGKLFNSLAVLPYKKEGRRCQILINNDKIVGFADAETIINKKTLVYQGQDGLWRPASTPTKLW